MSLKSNSSGTAKQTTPCCSRYEACMEDFNYDESRSRLEVLRRHVSNLKECFLVEIKYFNDEETSRLCKNSLNSLMELERYLSETKDREQKTWEEHARYFLV